MPDAEQPSIARAVAYALVALELDVIQRSTVRALLPAGTTRRNGAGKAATRRAKGMTGGSANTVSEAFSKRLRIFEGKGWIVREGPLLRVIDRAALLRYVQRGYAETPLPLLAVAEAMREAQREEERQRRAAVAELVEQRRLELLRLARLMHGPGGAQRRPVRIVNKTSAL